MFCRWLFGLLHLFFLPLWCLFFDLRIIITPLVSSNFSFLCYIWHIICPSLDIHRNLVQYNIMYGTNINQYTCNNRILLKEETIWATSATSGAYISHPSRAPKFASGVRVTWSLVTCVVFWWSFFILLWTLHCMFFFGLQILTTILYFQIFHFPAI